MKRKNIPVVRGKRKLPKGSGWTGQDIHEAVEELLVTEAIGATRRQPVIYANLQAQNSGNG